ncbi:hypothetical protein LCGC14_1408380 [marine sediment metagenome]|uniref:Uncharacterized protein n=1 Tax=marine sediment metagenome TaxID=412755 RepID=A0A0F9JUZ7_9ZZZZ
MKCPECEKAGLKSTIYDPGGYFITAMCVQSFWDEDGKRHVHDGNWRTKSYSCSNGHRWSESWRPKCPTCGKGGERKIINHNAAPL